MTPPNCNRGRVSKKSRKDAKKAAEVRLPGFSIMTKDGVDVTSSAGRGTKTKEQREHAHLMRIMKACDGCKRKKVRCDPSHRRFNEMSRSSTSTTPKTSPSRTDPSPTVSVPSLSAFEDLPSLNTNAMDDFVLFPEDTASWNPADMALPDFDTQVSDLVPFNFDMGELDFNNLSAGGDQSFDFSSFEPSPNIQQPIYHPLLTDQFGLDQWAGAWADDLVSHSRPHHPALASTQDSGQGGLESTWYSGGFQMDDSHVLPKSSIPAPYESTNSSPLSDNVLSTSPESLSSPDWDVHGGSVFANANVSANTSQEQSGAEEGLNRKERRSRERGLSKNAVQQLVDSVPSRHAKDLQEGVFNFTDQQSTSFYEPVSDSGSEGFGQKSSPSSSSSSSSSSFSSTSSAAPVSSLVSLERIITDAVESLQAFQSSPARDQSITLDVSRLWDTIDNVKSRIPDANVTDSLLDNLHAQIHAISENAIHQRHDQMAPEFRQEYVRQCQVSARRLVRSLCAVVVSLKSENPTLQVDYTVLARRRAQLASPFDRHIGVSIHLNDSEQLQVSSGNSYDVASSPSNSSSLSRYGDLLREDGFHGQGDAYEFGSDVGTTATIQKSSGYLPLANKNVLCVQITLDNIVPLSAIVSSISKLRQDVATQAKPVSATNTVLSHQRAMSRLSSEVSENFTFRSSDIIQVQNGSSRSTILARPTHPISLDVIPRSVLVQHDLHTEEVHTVRPPEALSGNMVVAMVTLASVLFLSVRHLYNFSFGA